MTAPKFTPGPWVTHDHAPWSVWSSAGQSGQKQIATCRVMSHDGAEITPNFIRSFEESTANAHLIGAAPELLEALKAAVEDECLQQNRDRRWHSLARAAILKAEGKSHD